MEGGHLIEVGQYIVYTRKPVFVHFKLLGEWI